MQTVFVTGANGGIGRALVTQFAKSGYNVVAHYRQEGKADLDFLKKLEDDYSITVTPVYFDLCDNKKIKESIKDLLTSGVSINVLVNCAGVAHGGFFQMTSIEKIKEIFEINFFSMLEITQSLLRHMVRRKSGCIINIASISGISLKPGNCAYGTSKAAVIAWTKTLAGELAPLGIRVNAIAPGLIDTDMAKQMDEKAGIEMINSSFMKRLGTPEEVAKAAVFIASDDASFINGQTICVDGGSTR